MTRSSKHTTAKMMLATALLFSVPTGVAAQPAGWFPTGSMASGRYGHAATLLPDGRVLVSGGRDVIDDEVVHFASVEVFDPLSGTWAPAANMAHPRSHHAATRLLDGRVLVVGSTGHIHLPEAHPEVYDPTTDSWSSAGQLNEYRVSPSATLLSDGRVLVVGGLGGAGQFAQPLTTTELYDPATGTWVPSGSLALARSDHTATLLPDGRVLVAGGTELSQSDSVEIWDPATGMWSITGAMTTPRNGHSAVLLPDGRVLVAGAARPPTVPSSVKSAEVYDSSTGTWSLVPDMASGRYGHSATLLPLGSVLVAGGFGESSGAPLTAAELFEPTGQWAAAASMGTSRVGHTATLLLDGSVLVTGGFTFDGAKASAEIYRVPTNVWFPAYGLNTVGRYAHTATALSDGNVLIAGGDNRHSIGSLASAEVYDWEAGAWSTMGSMTATRYHHKASLLPDGRVLVSGGYSDGPGYLASSELYDPTTRLWSATGNMTTRRAQHTSTLLTNGRVLAAGGDDDNVIAGGHASAELYDPLTGTWSATGSLQFGRYYHTATELLNGEVLVAGGTDGANFLASAEVYDPDSGAWSATGGMGVARAYHAAVRLFDGRVLAMGGLGGSGPLATAVIYHPVTGAWSTTGSMLQRRWAHSATLLPNGKVLVTGGFADTSGRTTLALSELYDPVAGTWSATGGLRRDRTLHTATLLPNGRVLVVGGFDATPTAYLASAELYNTPFVPPPSLSIQNVLVTEGDAGVTTAIFTVNLSAPNISIVTVQYATSDGTATADGDYFATAGTLTFNQGETIKTIAVSVNGDTNGELDETFVVTLANAINAMIAVHQGIGTIANDDAAPVSALTSSDVTIIEGDAGRMSRGRSSHSATRLLDGRVIVTAGRGGGTFSEIYDPATGAWVPTGSLSTARWVHTATLLTDGRLLLASGWNDTHAFASADVYDPLTGLWSTTGSMGQARWDHTATLLNDGRVLVAGGTVVVGSVVVTLASAELYDPSTGMWSTTGSLAAPRANHTASRLLDGRVLVIGGRGGLASAEVYDPSTGTWSAAGHLAQGRHGHASVLLPDGEVLVAGGVGGSGYLATAERYDPVANTWSPTGGMANARSWFSSAWLLPNGRVLVAGSWGGPGHASAELYDPATGTWSLTGSMIEGRGAHRTTLLLDGRVLATGGTNSVSGVLASAEVYDALSGTWSPAGGSKATFTVTLSPASAQSVTVNFATGDITAAAGSDYTATAGALTFAPGETTQTIEVRVNGDVDVEPDETFSVGLSGPTNAVIADGVATGTIVNNDSGPLSLPPAATPVGSNVSAILPPVSLTFDSVTQSGQTAAAIGTASPPPPTGFQFGNPPVHIDLSTTAAFSGSIEICIDYSGFSFANESLLKLFHFVSGAWTDITTSLDTVGDVICGEATSLSPFAMFEPASPFAPRLTLPANITTEATSAAGALVTFMATAIHENDGPVSVMCSPMPGAAFALGATSVNCSAADTAGNIASGSFIVNVVDTTAPTLNVPASMTIPATSASGAVVSFVASASDLVDGTVAATCTPSAGSTFPIGQTTVNCAARDGHGNQASRAFNVSVIVGTPRVSARVLAKTSRTAAGNITITLQISNTGTGTALNVVVDRLIAKSLSGSGYVTLVTPAPITVGTISVGGTRTISITVNVPSTVSRFSITEGGRYVLVNGLAHSFSMGQSVIP